MSLPQPVRPTRRRRRAGAVGRRAWVARTLLALAAVVAFTHVLEHLGVIQVFTPGLEDLLIGFPTAGLLAVVGGIALGR